MNKGFTAQASSLGLTDFLCGLFGAPADALGRRVHLASFPGSPRDPEVARWHGFRWAYARNGVWTRHAELPADCNQYFSIGLLKPDSVGRSDSLVEYAPLIALDDVGRGVGAKVEPSLVNARLSQHGIQPAAIVETSPGNFQLFYRVKEARELQRSSVVRAALCQVGLSDPAVHDLSRYMRLPFGRNGKSHFPVRLALWAPERICSLAQWEWVLSAAGADPGRLHIPVLGARAASMADPWVRLAMAVGLDPRETRPGVIEAECPFASEHSDGRGDGFAFINWERCHCHHGHCQDRRTRDFLERIAELYEEQNPGRTAQSFMARETFAGDGGELPYWLVGGGQ